MFVPGLAERDPALSDVCSMHAGASAALTVACFAVPRCCKHYFICCFIGGFICHLLGDTN